MMRTRLTVDSSHPENDGASKRSMSTLSQPKVLLLCDGHAWELKAYLSAYWKRKRAHRGVQMRKATQHKHLFLMHLGNAIKNRRLEMAITQQDLALRAKLHRTYITDVESGHRNISMLTYQTLTQGLLCAMSLPITEAERSMVRVTRSSLYGIDGGLSTTSVLLHSGSRFCQELDISALELQVKANMSKLQVAMEFFAREHNTYPRQKKELEEALDRQLPINPFTRKQEQLSMGSVTDEELATTGVCFLRPGEIEYSPLKKGVNYVIRGGGADGKGLPGASPGRTYVLSGNLRINNQP